MNYITVFIPNIDPHDSHFQFCLSSILPSCNCMESTTLVGGNPLPPLPLCRQRDSLFLFSAFCIELSIVPSTVLKSYSRGLHDDDDDDKGNNNNNIIMQFRHLQFRHLQFRHLALLI